MLVAARLRHIASTRWGAERYLQMNWLAEVVAIIALRTRESDSRQRAT